MKQKYRTLQADSYLLLEMLELRKLGWSSLELADRYHKDHTTILHHCKKHKIIKGKHPERTRGWQGRDISLVSRILDKKNKESISCYKHGYLNEQGEKVNQGRFYADYLKKANYKYKHLCSGEIISINAISTGTKRN